eukprot:4713788-Amphidinium_carterae.2
MSHHAQLSAPEAVVLNIANSSTLDKCMAKSVELSRKTCVSTLRHGRSVAKLKPVAGQNSGQEKRHQEAGVPQNQSTGERLCRDLPWDSVIKARNVEFIEPALDQRISRMTDSPRYAGGGDSSAPLAMRKRARVEDKPERH